MIHYRAFIVRGYDDRFQLIGFPTFDELLRSLPCRQGFIDARGNTPREWPQGTLLSDCATRESACVLLPADAARLSTMPWPDTLPQKCEAWIL